ncbi:unnamed protein product [Pocillopora meandrina]|uniref:C-type lectin domain-containing protein n=1 Tax=Pocillopora meandrina TaxID=46732 RepID=A0AAU9Y4X9_9CNID|nr:unnamed protein product [Pocillopora meandrina]
MTNVFFTVNLGMVLLCFQGIANALGTNPCFQNSCYLISDAESPATWTDNRETCKRKGGDLVSIETEAEWSFLNDEIQKRCIGQPNEWHIGLNKVGEVWKWVNNSPLTIDKWQTTHGEPSGDGNKAVMSKDYPPTKKGLFNDLPNWIKRAYICELPKEYKICFKS